MLYMGYGVSGGCWGFLTVSPPDFTRALGSGLSDKCLETPGGPPGPGCSRTAQQLRCLFPALALALRCLRLLPARPHGERGLGRGQVGLGILSVLTPTLSTPRGSLPAAAGAGPVPGGGGCCPRVADGPGRAVPGGLGAASVPAAHPGRPAGTGAQGAWGSGGDTGGLDSLPCSPPGVEGRGRAADAAGEWDLPRARGDSQGQPP